MSFVIEIILNSFYRVYNPHRNTYISRIRIWNWIENEFEYIHFSIHIKNKMQIAYGYSYLNFTGYEFGQNG
jgi:hypothetical protein